MKLIFALLLLFSSALSSASGFESFFTGLEGEWRLLRSLTIIRLADGTFHRSRLTKFDALMVRENSTWRLDEEYCELSPKGQEACEVAWLRYEVEGAKLFLATEEGKFEVQVQRLGPSRLEIFYQWQGFSVGSQTYLKTPQVVIQKNIMKHPDGTHITQVIMLKKI
jgi:hypothetical protein